ncbi:MAG: NAD(P)H-dependent flavin oxidoreductase [Promethearchaeota archaeon]
MASGGYATGEGLASAISMGVGAIAMGTRFISSEECEFHDNYKNVVINSKSSDTELITGVFGPARVLKNRITEKHKLVESKQEKQEGETSMLKVEQELAELEKTYEGKIDEGVAFLGQSVELINSVECVSDIINSIVIDAERCLTTAFNSIKKPLLKQLV